MLTHVTAVAPSVPAALGGARPLQFVAVGDLLVVAAFLLLVAGVVGSLVPQVPGPALSIAGVLLYWGANGFASPEPLELAVLLFLGVFTLVVDWTSGVLSAKIGGASTKTAVLAGVVGLVLLVFTSPIGMLVGVPVTVFLAEFYRQRDAVAGAKAAAVTTAGMLGSSVAQALLTGTMLIAMLWVAL